MGAEEKQEFVEALAHRYGEQLRRFLRTRVGRAEDVADIVQEVYLRLLRVPDHRTIRTPEAYIFTIARHVAQEHALQSMHAARAQEGPSIPATEAAVESDPALAVSAQQSIALLDAALDQLGPKVQACFLLHRRDGLTVEAIAQHLGLSVPMVKKYIVRALVDFRRRLQAGE